MHCFASLAVHDACTSDHTSAQQRGLTSDPAKLAEERNQYDQSRKDSLTVV